MAFGQSFIIGKIASKATKAMVRACGGSDEDARVAGRVVGLSVAGLTAVATLDAGGAAATATSEAAGDAIFES